MRKRNFSKSCLLFSSLFMMGVLSHSHQALAQETTMSDTDFLVVIPSGYALANDHQLDKNDVSICDKSDLTQAYKGEQEIAVKIQSAKNFTLGSSEGEHAKYRLIDENKKEVTADGQKISFVLSKDNARQSLHAQLTQKASDEVKASDQLLFTYKNEANISLKKTHIHKDVNEAWGEVELRENIIGLTNSKGEDVLASDKAKVQITAQDGKGNNVTLSDMTKASGVYRITYSYKGVASYLILEVGEAVSPSVGDDESTINFMGMTWSVLRGPSDMGEENYLIVAQSSLKKSHFNNSNRFFRTNDRDQDGYLESDVKQEIDKWYDANVKGTFYEQFVRPVVLPNPTLGDMIDYGVLESNVASVTDAAGEDVGIEEYWKSHDKKYRTRVDEMNGVKQAFAVSGADISTGVRADAFGNVGGGFSTLLTQEAKALPKIMWLRSPGISFDSAGALFPTKPVVHFELVDSDLRDVVPSLVVHIQNDTSITLKDSNIVKGVGDHYDEAALRENIIGLTNSKGEDVLAANRDKVQITAKDASGNNVALTDLTKAEGTYTITYSYGGKAVEAKLIVESKASITLKENKADVYVREVYGEEELRENIIGLTNSKGEDVLTSDKSKVEITAKDASGNDIALTDLTKAEGTYTITYSYSGKTVEANLTVKDKASITLKESPTTACVYVGDTYGESELRANILTLTNTVGEDVSDSDRNKVEISVKNAQGVAVDLSELTKTAGIYTVTYNYEGRSAKENVIILDEFQFANHTWSILRGPNDLGKGNYLVALQSIGVTSFKDSEHYFDNNNRDQDGYLTSNVKKMIDDWYNANIKGTEYEQSVQPVVLPNPTLGDVSDLGMLNSYEENGTWFDGSTDIFEKWWKTHDVKYRTRIDETNGTKQAFALSAADVSDGSGNSIASWTTKLLPAAKAWVEKGNGQTWLRSVGGTENTAAWIDTPYLNYRTVTNFTADVVPSLVIHVDK